MNCKNCKNKLPQSAKFCEKCGAVFELPQKCDKCGGELKEIFQFARTKYAGMAASKSIAKRTFRCINCYNDIEFFP